jgi:polysaccharide chain length determinant protein (PEP-CTERM system associated)
MMNDVFQRILIYAVGLWKKRWYIALVAWILCPAGWFGVSRLPDNYEAQARIYVDTDSLLAPLLRGISVEGNIIQQVDFIQRTLLSEPNMEKLTRMTDLDLTVKNQTEKEQLIKDLAKRIQVTQNQGRNLFSVSFSDVSPAVAQRVVQSLLSIFVESNIGQSRSDIEKARKFLEDQIDQYEKQLQAAESRLADFKKKNLSMLAQPGTASYEQSLETAKKARDELKNQLEEAQSRRDAVVHQLATVPETVEVNGIPQVYVQGGAAKALPPALASIQTRIDETEKELDTLNQRFTPNHPDVKAAKRRLEGLKREYAEAETAQKTAEGKNPKDDGPKLKGTVPNALYEQLKLKIVDYESTILTLRHKLELAEGEVRRLEDLANTAPAMEAQFATLNRDYGIIKKNYEELVARREAAKLTDAVEVKGEKIQFRMVDPPQVPTLPSGPPRLILCTAILIASIGAGLAVAFLLSQLNDAFITLASLREAVALPVLGSVTLILTAADRRRRLLHTVGFAASMGTLIMTYSALAVMMLRNPKIG